MIAYINGKLVFASEITAIVSVGGLGYEVYYKNNFVNSDFGSEIELFITHKSSEYGDSLFGFKTIEEKILFEDLTNIKGIGSKIVYSIMSELNIRTYSDLYNLKLDVLTKISGVGKNTAQKFLLGISSKLKSDFVLESQNDSVDISKKFDEIIETLVGWGMKKAHLIEFISKNYNEISGLSNEKAIQFILKNMK